MRSRAVNLPALCSRSRRSAPPPASASAFRRRSSSLRSPPFAASGSLGVGIKPRLVSDTGSSLRRGFGQGFGGSQGQRLLRAKDAHSQMSGKPGGTEQQDDAQEEFRAHGGSAVQGRLE